MWLAGWEGETGRSLVGEVGRERGSALDAVKLSTSGTSWDE